MDPKDHQEEEPLRRTARANAGAPPQRYGFVSTPIQNRPAEEVVQDMSALNLSRIPNPASSVASGHSVRSTSSSYKKKRMEVELEMARQKAAMELEDEELAMKLQAKLHMDQIELQRKRLKKNKELLELEKDLKMAEIDEEEEFADDHSQRSDEDLNRMVESAEKENQQGGQENVKEWAEAQGRRSPSPVHLEKDTLGVLKLFAEAQLKQANAQEQQVKAQLQQTELMRDNGGSRGYRRFRDLPNFGGEPDDWPKFIADFRYSTYYHQIADIDNLHRLEKALKGKAKDLVKSYLSYPHMVEKILETLQERYGRPEFIIKFLMEKVRDIKKIKEDQVEELLDLSSAVDNLTVTVEVLKQSGYLNNPQLLEELELKLPMALKMSWGKERGKMNDAVNLRHFADWMKDETRGLVHFCNPSKKKEKDVDKSKRARQVGHINQDGEESQNEVHSVNKEEKPKRSPCARCGKGHKTEDCFKAMTVKERWEHIKKNNMCANCFRKGHMARECPKDSACRKEGCERKHHTWLHDDRPPRQPQAPQAEAEPVGFVKSEFAGATNDFEGKVILKVVPVILTGPKKSSSTFAFLDDGSKVTMVDEQLARELGVTMKMEDLKLKWVRDTRKTVKTSLVTLDIRGESKKETFTLKDIQTFPNLDLFVQSVSQADLRKWKLGGMGVRPYAGAKPGILIGTDYAHLFSPRHKEGRPVIEDTKLGRVISGPVPGTSKLHSVHVVDAESKGDVLNNHHEPERDHHEPSGKSRKSQKPNEIFGIFCVQKEEDFHQLVKDFFVSENFAVNPPNRVIQSRENERAMTIMENTTKLVDGSWETGLLWRDDNPVLPNNYHNTLKRLTSVERKMDLDPTFAEKYQEKIQEYVTKGFAHKLTPDEKGGTNIWYLPHFRHINPKKPGKFRLVFDAAAKTNGVSLNSFLMKGPDLYKPLPEVLVKFREHRFGFSADIKDMFHKVKVIQDDLPSQRFLWRGMDRSKPPDIYQMDVMVFGAACSPASAQFVKNKSASRFSSEFLEAVDAIINKHYVDDYLDSVDTLEEAQERIRNVIQNHGKGGFEIVNWIASDPLVLSNVPTGHLAPAKKVSLAETYTERVLGIYWDPDKDHFTFTKRFVGVRDNLLNGEEIPTKREVLQVVASMFDPLGYVEHFKIKGKIIHQETWKHGIGWDDEIPESLFIKWKSWLQELEHIDEVRIPRCYELNVMEASNVFLHIFVDAGEQAYAAVAYFTFEFYDRLTSALVMAKARVASVKPKMSIPRLELQAAVLGSRVATAVKNMHNYKIKEVHFWADSWTVLRWIRSDSRKFKAHVAHRIAEIEETTEGATWHWVPSKLNVADLATKDSIPTGLDPDSVWFKGPEFIRGSRDDWPQEPDAPQQDTELLEMKKEEIFTVVPIEPYVKWDHFSNWTRLVNAIAYVRRVFKNKEFKKTHVKLVKLTVKKMIVTRSHPQLTATERQEAIIQIWKWVQEESFPEEAEKLRAGNTISRSSRLNKLSPFLDSKGTIRMKGRLDNAQDLERAAKCPIILDPHHVAVKLLIAHYHKESSHQGQETVLNNLRSEYWILSARSAVRKAFWECRKCQMDKPIPITQEMGQLPMNRVTKQFRAFTHIGVDYFGPMEVTVGRRREKRWGALFTCMATRAVHIELADFLTTDSAIMALRRMIARRGHPESISSDNGTNFHGADNELQKAIQELEQNKLEEEATKRGITWKFNPPSAPHMGGVWERLVKSVKVALKNTLNEKAPKQEILHTLMVEAENVVNSRPLTYVSSDPKDPESLTPNHFLIGNSNGGRVPGVFNEDDIWLKQQWRAAQALADEFWRRWIREYLPTLNKRSKWHEKGQQLKVGDIVFIADGDLPRGTWPKGIVEAVFPGQDGQIRVVDVRTGKGKVFRRPVAKIMVPRSGIDSGKEEPESGGSMSLRQRGAQKNH